jgi:hypothetical protein
MFVSDHFFFVNKTINANAAKRFIITRPKMHLSHCAAFAKNAIVLSALFNVDFVSFTLS